MAESDKGKYLNYPSGAAGSIDGPTDEPYTSVHAIQTSGSKPMLNSFRKQMGLADNDEFRAVEKAYRAIPSENATHPADRLDECSRRAWFYRNTDTGEVRVSASRCNLRWCPMCSNARRRQITDEVGSWLLKRRGKKFITLTLKHENTPLAGQLDLLYTYFKYLRKKKIWKSAVRGGIWFFQVTLSANDGMWHPHLHVLVDSNWIEQEYLRDEWLKITKTSYIVHIKPVTSDMKASEYVARYGSRPAALADKGPGGAVEIITALHDRRIIGTFGTARGLKLTPQPPENPELWERVGSWFEVRNWFDKSEAARTIYTAWICKVKLGPGITLEDRPEPHPPPIEVPPVSTYKQLKFDFNQNFYSH
jgi:hypothetical protein